MTSNMQMLMLIMMWITLMSMWMTKTPKLACLLLTVYSILISIMISTMIKMTLIPFIMVLTMAGGLMILFLYFTASMETQEKKQKMETDQVMLLIMVVWFTMMSMQLPNNTKSPMMEITIPTSIMFIPQSSPMTMIMVALLGIMLIMVIFICSKSKSTIRKKKSN